MKTEILTEAKEYYREYFNQLPYEQRIRLGTAYDRWLEAKVCLKLMQNVLKPLQERELTLRKALIKDYQEIKEGETK